jgi:hypothetical protein
MDARKNESSLTGQDAAGPKPFADGLVAAGVYVACDQIPDVFEPGKHRPRRLTKEREHCAGSLVLVSGALHRRWRSVR